MTATAAPAVIDALVALGRATFGESPETVDGYTYAAGDAHLFVVGVSDPADPTGSPAWTSRQEPMESFSGDRHEFLTVTCQFVIGPFDTMKEARDALVADLDLFDTALRADRTLGRVVQEAHLGGDFAMNQSAGPSGDEVRLAFLVTADVYLQ